MSAGSIGSAASAPDAGSPATPLYDLRGLTCPMPVLKTRKRLLGMKPGERLLVWTTDPLAIIDIPVFCRQDGHHLLESGASADGHAFLIARGEKPSEG